MTVKERNNFAQAIIDALDNDDYLYEILPGDGKDDYILQTIRSIINKVRLEWNPNDRTK